MVNKELYEVIKDKYYNLFWTHKIHEKQADIYLEYNTINQWAEIGFAALTTCGIGYIFANDSLLLKILTIASSFVTVLISAIPKTFQFMDMSIAHKKTAKELVVLRDKMLFLIANMKSQSVSDEEARAEFKNISCKIDEAYKNAPTTTKKAVKKAAKEMGRVSCADDALPEYLRGDIK